MRSIWIVLVVLVCGLLPGLAMAQGEGILEVTANADGALVYVDGELRGPAPLMEVVSAGYHMVRVEHPSFSQLERRVLVAADTSVTVAAQLERIRAGLSIRVDVPGARVFLDGKQVGVGDVVVDPVRPGRHRLVVETEDFGRYEATIRVAEGKVTPVEVNVRGALGSLVVRSRPEGAMVVLDGEEMGLTPLTINTLPPGNHGLRVQAAGGAAALRSIFLDPGESKTVEVELAAEGGVLEIKARPQAGVVSVNGVSFGSGATRIGPLAPGSYSIRVSAPGYIDFLRSVQVEAGKTHRVAARMRSFDVGGAGGGPIAGSASGKPVHQQPGFWVGVGAGSAAVVAAIVVGIAMNSGGDDPLPVPGTPAPPATYTFSLP